MPALAGRAKPSAAMVIWLAIGLMAVGVVMVFSASAWPDGRWGGGWFWQQPGLRQLVFVAVAAGAMTAAGLIPYRWWRFEPGRWGSPTVMVTAGAVVCLMVVLVPSVGLERHGARRWLAIGPRQYGLGFQPSELAKVAMVLFLAAYMGGGRAIGRFWRGLLPACLVVGAMIGLIGVEDFGTAVLLGMVAGGMLLVGGARLGHLVAVSVPAAAGLAAMLWVRPYRLERLASFGQIWSDPMDRGYHAIQSLVSLAVGGWWGVGLGGGMQKLGYLPQARSDFIFAVIGEELGLAGAAVVVGLYGLLIWHGRKVMLAAEDGFGRLLAFGVTWLIGLQAAMNIAVVTVTVPTKGIGLPLVSAGGSGLVFLSVAVGLLASVARLAGRQECPSGH